jgi:hypothetical protein
MTLGPFVAEYLGKPNVGTNQVNAGECVGLVMKYITSQGIPWFPGNAKDLYANASPEYFDKIKGQIPQEGDIAVFNEAWGNGLGHTGIIVNASSQSFTLFEQNNPYGSPPRIGGHPASHYGTIIGYLRIKGGEVNLTPTDVSDIINFFYGRGARQNELDTYAINNPPMALIKQIMQDSPVTKLKAQVAELERSRDQDLYPEIERLRASKADPDAIALKDLIKKVVKE